MRTLVSLFALSLAPVLASTAQADVDAVTLLRTGLGPDALAAAGVTSAEVTATVADLAASDAATNGDLATADAAFRSAKSAASALARKVKAGNSSAEEKADYVTAKATLASAEASRDAVLDALHTAAVADLSAAKKATLAQLRANQGRKGYATELLVVSRTDAEWIALKQALEHEKVCTEDGEELHSSVVTLLASVRSASAVSSAKANLDANLASITVTWNAAVNG